MGSEHVHVIFGGAPAGSLRTALGHTGVGFIAVPPISVDVILHAGSLAVLATAMLMAFAKGYKISGKARDSHGNEYTIEFRPA